MHLGRLEARLEEAKVEDFSEQGGLETRLLLCNSPCYNGREGHVKTVPTRLR